MQTEFTCDGAVALGHLGVIRASGADAASFLQGQLTNDVSRLGDGEARLAGFCSAKGRLQASFIVWRSGDELLLACSTGVLAATVKRLSMFVLRARCKLSDASAEVRLSGLLGTSAQACCGDLGPWQKAEVEAGTAIRLPDVAGTARCIVATGADAVLPAGTVTLDLWRWLEVRSGVPTIEAATVDRFVPQMINFEILGGVDFQKGCYPGQEVVARSQYRGTVKRRMQLFDLAAPAASGVEVFHTADPSQPAGMVVNAAPHPAGGSSALVEVKLSALDEGGLHLGRIDGPELRRGALPYAVDAPA